MHEWRLIDSGYGRGNWNMAVDEAIVRSVQSEDSLPTLRYCGWKPPMISVEFSITTPVQGANSEGANQISEKLAHVIMTGMRLMGIETLSRPVDNSMEDAERGTGLYEIIVNNSVLGTFQVKHFAAAPKVREVLFLQGSILLRRSDDLGKTYTSLEEVFEGPAGYPQVVENMTAAFENEMDVMFQPGFLSEIEKADAEELADRYTEMEWPDVHRFQVPKTFLSGGSK